MKLVIDNENKKLSQSRRRIERKIKLDNKMKTILNENKVETKKKNKNVDKLKELQIELVKIKFSNNLNKLQSELKELNKNQVVNKNLHEIKQIVSRDYAGEFEMVVKISVGVQIRRTHNRFRNVTD